MGIWQLSFWTDWAAVPSDKPKPVTLLGHLNWIPGTLSAARPWHVVTFAQANAILVRDPHFSHALNRPIWFRRTRQVGESRSGTRRPRRGPSAPGRGSGPGHEELDAACRDRVCLIDHAVLEREEGDRWVPRGTDDIGAVAVCDSPRLTIVRSVIASSYHATGSVGRSAAF